MAILLIEDNERIAELISRSLQQDGYSLVHAKDGEEGKHKALEEEFDLLIIDIILPKLDGLSLCKELRKHKPEQAIIMLTALGSTDEKVKGFDAGADDYLVKPFALRELLARIKALLKRRKQASDIGYLLRYADLEMNLKNFEVQRQKQKIQLSPKEFALLEYFLRNPERVLSRQEIALHVWDMHFDTGTNFIDVYINYLRKKIEKNFDSKLIKTKPGLGFILQADEN